MCEKDPIKLIEVFNSWQGEGPDSGKAMIILRFKTCNLNCSWCDTRVKMRITPEAEYPLAQLQEIINETGSGILVTGGEPTMAKHYNDCLKLLNYLEYPIANVESNGCQLVELVENVKKNKKVNYIFSPKIFHLSDAEIAEEKALELFNRFPGKIYLKIVYENNNMHLKMFMERICNLKNKIPGQFVYLMPEGTTRATLIQNSEKVFDAAEKYRFNFSSRDHIIYGFV